MLDVRTSKATGVQTDEIGAVPQALSHDDLRTYDDLSKKLLAIWGSPNEQELGRNLICNLLMDCQTDFHFLFGCIGMKMPSKLTMDKLGDDSSSIAASKYYSQMSHTHTPEAEMVSHLYSVLTKVFFDYVISYNCLNRKVLRLYNLLIYYPRLQGKCQKYNLKLLVKLRCADNDQNLLQDFHDNLKKIII